MESIPHGDDRLPGGASRYNPEPAPDLLARRLRPQRVIVDGLLGEGATLLVGPAKSGKSWLALDLARHVATGCPWLGYEVQAGGVLYLALQGGEVSLQSRLRDLLDGDTTPLNRLSFVYCWPRLEAHAGRLKEDAGGLLTLAQVLDRDPSIALVCCDMYVDVKPLRKGADGDVYASDYGIIAGLNDFALERRIALLLLHHSNKKPLDPHNPQLAASGSMGLTGAASASWILHRPFASDAASLFVSSRQFESRPVLLRWSDVLSAWAPAEADDPDALALTRRTERHSAREAVLAAFAEANGQPLTVRQVSDATGLSMKQSREQCSRMERDRQLARLDLGVYQTANVLIPQGVNDISRLVYDSTNPEIMGTGGQEQPANVLIPQGVNDISRLVWPDDNATNPEKNGNGASHTVSDGKQTASTTPFLCGPDGMAYSPEHYAAHFGKENEQ